MKRPEHEEHYCLYCENCIHCVAVTGDNTPRDPAKRRYHECRYQVPLRDPLGRPTGRKRRSLGYALGHETVWLTKEDLWR